MGYRIEQHPILDIESKKEITFYFQGKEYKAHEGEPISSALFANGIYCFGKHEKDHSSQGIFCANGQCSQCLVLVDQLPVKACITTIKEGMHIEPMIGNAPLPADDQPLNAGKVEEENVDVLIVGAGPAGLTAALELAPYGVSIILADDKKELGGKLSLQTHNFFGSIKECYAGERGISIGQKLATEVAKFDNISVRLDSPVVGVFVDGKVGIVQQGHYHLINPKVILVATGAREKNLLFPGCDLPGVYGAGAFQTLVNRDRVRAAKRLFIVGGGNVGLIAAYHALQAGIEVVGLAEALPQCGGYKVHLDKIKRLGVPVFTSHSVLKVAGNDSVEQICIAQVDNKFQPIANTEKTFNVDTVLIAVGLSPVHEILCKAREYGLCVYGAGDAESVAEASAAMFSGKITARKILQKLGFDSNIPDEWEKMSEVLRSRPGSTLEKSTVQDKVLYPNIFCVQEIPCNPCTEVCPKHSININSNTLMGLPKFNEECIGCGKCVAICPGLAITLVDKRHDETKRTAQVTIPWEMNDDIITVDSEVTTVDMQGNLIGRAKVLQIKNATWQNHRRLLVLEVPYEQADLIAGIRLPMYANGEETAEAKANAPKDTIVCRCKRVTEQEIREQIRKGVRDLNSMKALLGTCMGPCGGKTCEELILRIFQSEGISLDEVTRHVVRPFTQEVRLSSFLGETK